MSGRGGLEPETMRSMAFADFRLDIQGTSLETKDGCGQDVLSVSPSSGTVIKIINDGRRLASDEPGSRAQGDGIGMGV